MSKPVFQDIFRFSGRRNRKSYVLFGLAVFVFLIVLVAIFAGIGTMIPPNANTQTTSSIIGTIVFIIMIPVAISGWAVGSQRCRDFGWTGWAMLITLIPIVGAIFAIAILFIPGTQGPNRYGPDPIGATPFGAPAY